jgi:hypothetical protein
LLVAVIAERLVAGLSAAAEGYASVFKEGLAKRTFYMDIPSDVQWTIDADGDYVLLRYGLCSTAVLRLELQGSGGTAYNDFGDALWECPVRFYPGSPVRIEHLG